MATGHYTGQTTAGEVASDLRMHEAVCTERYLTLVKTMDEIKRGLFWAFTLWVSTMVGVVIAFAIKWNLHS